MSEAKIVTIKRVVTTLKRAVESVVTSARAPMIGGPAKKPKYPAVATAAIPFPEGMSGRVPAVLNRIGIRFDKPRPTQPKPRRTVAGWGKRSGTARPEAAKKDVARVSDTGPIRVTNRSPANLPAAIISEKDA